MKKLFVFMFITILFVSVTITSFAESKTVEDIDSMSKDSILKVYSNQLEKAGYNKTLLSFLTEKELKDIIKNNGVLLKYSQSYDLFVTSEKAKDSSFKVQDTNTIVQETKVIKLTKSEYDNLKKFNKKEDLLNYINNNGIDYLTNFDSSIVVKTEEEKVSTSSADFEATDYLDTGILETSLDVSDVSTSSECNKILGFNFNWTVMPNYTLTDGLGISHTAGYFDNYIDKGFYVDHYTPANQGWHTELYSTEWNLYGVSGNWDPKMNDVSANGRIWEKVGNAKSAVPEGAKFTIIGQYGHKQIVGGISVAIGKGSITFTPTFSGTIKKSTQIWLNDILTY
ncbi:hypothetical protein [Sporosalibacterium faouarense]|uniref:hypothetical protein n=1 Tax=Sporosalibacterium faouarense TaxID=516123 RepID=UPI00192BC5F3|nr:hypothetical protein [Sporosalibacterium faouarense]